MPTPVAKMPPIHAPTFHLRPGHCSSNTADVLKESSGQVEALADEPLLGKRQLNSVAIATHMKL
jgi:hypothetical protein